MARLDGRVAILTGGAKGIGVHYARTLAAEGARLMIADIADGKDLAGEIARDHGANSVASRAHRRQRRRGGEGAGRRHHGSFRQDRRFDQ